MCDQSSGRLGTRTTPSTTTAPLRTEDRVTVAGVMSPYWSNENEPRNPPFTRVLNSSSTTTARVPSERAIASRSTSAACAASSKDGSSGAPTERRKRRAAGASPAAGTPTAMTRSPSPMGPNAFGMRGGPRTGLLLRTPRRGRPGGEHLPSDAWRCSECARRRRRAGAVRPRLASRSPRSSFDCATRARS